MNATNRMSFLNKVAGGVLVGVVTLALPFAASAEQNLDASSQTKVNNAKAKAWSQGTMKGGYEAQNSKTMVNIGSKKGGTCGVNIGTVKPGEKAPKDIVVTTKDVINICK